MATHLLHTPEGGRGKPTYICFQLFFGNRFFSLLFVKGAKGRFLLSISLCLLPVSLSIVSVSLSIVSALLVVHVVHVPVQMNSHRGSCKHATIGYCTMKEPFCTAVLFHKYL